MLRVEMMGPGTYVSERVQVVVGQFQLLEGDQLPHPVRPGGWRVRVDVEPAGHGGLGLPGHRPESQRHGQATDARVPAAVSHACAKRHDCRPQTEESNKLTQLMSREI